MLHLSRGGHASKGVSVTVKVSDLDLATLSHVGVVSSSPAQWDRKRLSSQPIHSMCGRMSKCSYCSPQKQTQHVSNDTTTVIARHATPCTHTAYRILFRVRRRSFGGKLPMSFPRSVPTVPAFCNYVPRFSYPPRKDSSQSSGVTVNPKK
ncbi:hypothetical protein L210DRAFT_3173433 [Boletus edulis BED1]|uniref:Uncharacterized protein n=1 Tax=Boletus edulis BED1 TaxID=1328754 RepID=A0AAD4G7W4_BOLED|nr:hypothetical protein L210DRAFT_3173433 [Boletus edulis BED1]